MAFKKDYRVENVVASCKLFAEIPLEKVAQKLTNTEYNPEQFPGLVLRLLGEGITALVFSSGNIVCTGAKSAPKVDSAVKMIIAELGKADIKITKEPEITIQNMVASGDLGERLNLTDLAFKLKTAEYEPEQFPGLVYKVPASHITFLLFGTGKIVCTGAKNDKEIDTAVDNLIKELKGIMKVKSGKDEVKSEGKPKAKPKAKPKPKKAKKAKKPKK
jgi:transcription initiation factor TFIID TATA-box-binding protein